MHNEINERTINLIIIMETYTKHINIFSVIINQIENW